MPKVWLYLKDDTTIQMFSEPVEDGVEVEVKASKYRQVQAAEKRWWLAQVTLDRWYHRAVNDGVKRFE